MLREEIEDIRELFEDLRWEIICEPFPDKTLCDELSRDAAWIRITARSTDQVDFGRALSKGIEMVPMSSSVVVTMDGDGSHRPSEIPVMVNILEDHSASVVIASRYIRGGRSDNGYLLRLMSRSLNLLFSLTLRVNVKDVSNNFRALRLDCLPTVQLRCKNFDAVEELLLHVKYLGKSRPMVEVETHFKERNSGVSKRRLGPFILSYLIALIRIDREVRKNYH